MKFDSTMYLYSQLLTELKLNSLLAENCLRLLNGLTIQPMSMHFDKETESLSFKGSFPKSDLIVSQIYVSKSCGLSIYATLKGDNRAVLHINISLSSLSSSSVLIMSGNEPMAGIYYDTTKLIKDDIIHTYQFFDLYTLNDIKSIAVRDNLSLDDLITNNPYTLNSLGYMPDKESIYTIDASAIQNRAENINRYIKELSFDCIKPYLEKMSCEPSSSNNPIHI